MSYRFSAIFALFSTLLIISNFGFSEPEEFQVNNYYTNDQTSPSVAMNDVGDFIIVWKGEGTEDIVGIYARQYTND